MGAAHHARGCAQRARARGARVARAAAAGVIGVFYYLMNPNARRNLHQMEGDEPLNNPREPSKADDGKMD